METAEGVAAKRRTLVEALALCLERSEVAKHVDGETLRSVLSAASEEMWREGELRLEYLWKLLCQQPGLGPKEIAPALLVVKAHEEVLAVAVRLPQALSSLPPAEQERLRAAAPLGREELEQHLASLEPLPPPPVEEAAPRPRERAPSPVPAPPAPASRAFRKRLAAVLSVVMVASLGTSLYFAFRDTSKPVDLSALSRIVPLTGGVRDGVSMVARLADPGWDQRPSEDKERLAGLLFDQARPLGIRSLTLLDAAGHQRVIVAETESGRIKFIQ